MSVRKVERVGMGGVVDYGEREDRMNEHEKDTRRDEPGSVLDREEVGDPWAVARSRDLVLDLSGTRELDTATIALLLTAQQQALKDNRAVWLAGIPRRVWEVLLSLGLGSCFRPFPVSRDLEV